MARMTTLKALTLVAAGALAGACAPYGVYGPSAAPLYGAPVYDDGYSAAPQVFRTADGKVFATAAERSAYLRRNARIEQELYELELQRQRQLSTSLAAQQQARRQVRIDRLEREARDAERAQRQALREARRAEREADRLARESRLNQGTPRPLPVGDVRSPAERQAERIARERARDEARRRDLEERRAQQQARQARVEAERARAERDALRARTRVDRRGWETDAEAWTRHYEEEEQYQEELRRANIENRGGTK